MKTFLVDYHSVKEAKFHVFVSIWEFDLYHIVFFQGFFFLFMDFYITNWSFIASLVLYSIAHYLEN